jgi:hypothetical protein
MFHIPGWISNVLLLIACVLSGWQHSQLRHPNPVVNVQFFTMVLTILMMVAVTLYHPVSPWPSLVFFLIAVACLVSTIRQQRMMPPNKLFE